MADSMRSRLRVRPHEVPHRSHNGFRIGKQVVVAAVKHRQMLSLWQPGVEFGQVLLVVPGHLGVSRPLVRPLPSLSSMADCEARISFMCRVMKMTR